MAKKSRDTMPSDNSRRDELKQILVEALLDESLADELHERLLEWFDEETEKAQKQQAMIEYMYDHLEPNEDANDPTARQWFREVASRMGIELPPERDRRPDAEHKPATERESDPHLKPVAKRTDRRVIRLVAAGVAAAVVVVAMVVATVGTGRHGASDDARQAAIAPEVPATVELLASESERVAATLPDGSQVTLHAGELHFDEDFAHGRRVYLDGEAFFTVTRDEGRPFTIEGGGVEVTVLGTEFSMRAHGDEGYAEVAVATGSVRVAYRSQSVTLAGLERALVDRERHSIEVEELPEGEMLRLRRVGLTIEDVGLHHALRMIGDYYGVRVAIPEDMRSDTDGIVLKLDETATLDEALQMLKAVRPLFDYRIGEGEVTITKRK